MSPNRPRDDHSGFDRERDLWGPPSDMPPVDRPAQGSPSDGPTDTPLWTRESPHGSPADLGPVGFRPADPPPAASEPTDTPPAGYPSIEALLSDYPSAEPQDTPPADSPHDRPSPGPAPGQPQLEKPWERRHTGDGWFIPGGEPQDQPPPGWSPAPADPDATVVGTGPFPATWPPADHAPPSDRPPAWDQPAGGPWTPPPWQQDAHAFGQQQPRDQAPQDQPTGAREFGGQQVGDQVAGWPPPHDDVRDREPADQPHWGSDDTVAAAWAAPGEWTPADRGGVGPALADQGPGDWARHDTAPTDRVPVDQGPQGRAPTGWDPVNPWRRTWQQPSDDEWIASLHEPGPWPSDEAWDDAPVPEHAAAYHEEPFELSAAGHDEKPRRRRGASFLAVAAVTSIALIGSASGAAWWYVVARDDPPAQEDPGPVDASRSRNLTLPADTSPTPTITSTPTPTTATPRVTKTPQRKTRTPTPAPPPPEPKRTATPTPSRTAVPKPKPSSPKPTQTKTPSPSPTSPQAAFELEVVRLTNAERADAGCDPLRVDERLQTAARAHSEDMRDRGYFDHTSPDGKTPWDRMRAAGYDEPGGENIAMGYPTPEAVVEAWMESKGHRANILNCKFEAIGVGVALGDGGPWWTQDFGYE